MGLLCQGVDFDVASSLIAPLVTLLPGALLTTSVIELSNLECEITGRDATIEHSGQQRREEAPALTLTGSGETMVKRLADLGQSGGWGCGSEEPPD